MSSEVQLTDGQVDAIVKGLAKIGRPDYRECVRAGEQAVRAQWAAYQQDAEFVIGEIQKERDSAQAEAKRLREALTDFVNKSHRLPIGPERDAMYQQARAALNRQAPDQIDKWLKDHPFKSIHIHEFKSKDGHRNFVFDLRKGKGEFVYTHVIDRPNE